MKKRRVEDKSGPSKASLEAMPEIDFSKVREIPNNFPARIAATGTQFRVHPKRGRPWKGTETGPTIPKSVRFPASVWKELEKRAKELGLPVHAALRAAVLTWVTK